MDDGKEETDIAVASITGNGLPIEFLIKEREKKRRASPPPENGISPKGLGELGLSIKSTLELQLPTKRSRGRPRLKEPQEFNFPVDDGSKIFKCDKCLYTTTVNASLQQHYNTHTKPFLCEFENCLYRASQKQLLHIHERKHRNEKPYWCSFCDFKTVTKASLTVHERRHTGETPYVCRFCSYKANQKGYLDVHMRKHHIDEFKVLGYDYNKEMDSAKSVGSPLSPGSSNHSGKNGNAPESPGAVASSGINSSKQSHSEEITNSNGSIYISRGISFYQSPESPLSPSSLMAPTRSPSGSHSDTDESGEE